MKIFDPYIRSGTQSEADLKNLHYFGVQEVVTTAHGGHHFETAADLIEYFEFLVDDECRRLRRCQLQPHVGLGVVPDAQPRRAHPEVWTALERMLDETSVVALGEVGVWRDEEAHWELFRRQVRIADRVGPMPILVTPPRRLKVNLTYKMMNWLERYGYPPSKVVMGGLDERMIKNVIDSGFCAGCPVGAARNEPREIAGLLAELAGDDAGAERILLTAALRSSGGDLLGIPKTIEALQQEGVDDATIQQLVYNNASRLFGTASSREASDSPGGRDETD